MSKLYLTQCVIGLMGLALAGQTSHTDDETKIAYKGDKFSASRTIQISDNAFLGETFRATHNGDVIIFKGKGHDVTLTINDDVIMCEKLSCIPLGEVH